MKKNWILCASIVAAGWLSTPAFSAVNFDLALYKDSTTNTSQTNVDTPIAYGSTAWGNERTFTNNTVSATASAWSGTGGTGGLNTQTIEAAYLPIWSGGLGVYNRDAANPNSSDVDTSEFNSPEHAMDNEGRADTILLNFSSQKVNLSSVQMGWWSGDSDFFVLAYTGSGAPPLSGQAYPNLDNVGWTLVGNYSNAGTSVTNLNAPSIYSSFWLIGAGGFDANTGVVSGSSKILPNGADYLKLAAVSGVTMNGGTVPPAGVPEPGSLALAGIALLGVMGVRRRKAAA